MGNETKRILTLNDVTKTVDRRNILTPISLNLHEGEIFILVGPTGSGKTLLTKTIINLSKKSGGTIRINNRAHTATLYNTPEVGYFLWEQSFDNKKTAYQVLNYSARMGGKEIPPRRLKNMLEMMGLMSLKKIPTGRFGTQEIARLKIACALITKPKVLILDSPFGTMSTEDARAVRIILKSLAQNLGTAMIITSPTLEGVEEICDTVGIIANGVIVSIKTYNEMTKPNEDQAKIGITTTTPNYASKLIEKESKLETHLRGDMVIVNAPPTKASELNDLLTKNGIEIIKMEKIHKSIQEEYLKVLKQTGNVFI